MIRFTIYGQPCSKANSRRLVLLPDGNGGKRIAPVKSKEGLAYERDALKQIPAVHRVQMEGPVKVTLRLFYASERPDLDESLVLDVLQDRFAKNKETGQRELVQKGVYRNDRQVREKHVIHGIDRKNPRVEILVEPMQAQQPALEVGRPRAAVPAGTPF